MVRYTIRRLILTVPIVLIVVFLVFTLLFFTPGDPAVMILGDTASTEELDAMRAYLGVDRPYFVQLGSYYKQLFTGNLGESWVYRTNVSYEIRNRMPYTFAICVFSVAASALIGIPLGVMAAVHQNGIADKIVLAMSSILSCVPNFCIGLILIIIFALRLNWLPAYGISAGIRSYILPCASILIGCFAGISRQMRSSMLEVIRSDFVVSARAQGFSRRSVNYRHALPNALIPIITILGSQFAAGLGGTLILETIFSIPGLGLYVQGAISKRDTPATLGCVVFLSILFCIIMLCIDLLYAAVDPRIRAQYKERGRRYRKRETGRNKKEGSAAA